MKIKYFVSIIILLVLLISCLIVFPSVYIGYVMFREFIQPDYMQIIEKKWNGKSSEYLLMKLKGNHYAFVSLAASILYERKEKGAIPVLIKRIQSRDEDIRSVAIYSLARWNDENVIKPLMEIVESGVNHNNYLDALDALSIIGYDKIYPKILALEKEGSHTAYVVDMLERFPEKQETLQTLQKIADNNPDIYIQEKAKSAITNIKK